MAIAHEFDYIKPATEAEALALLEAHGAEAAILAGGTDLVVHMREDVRKPKMVIDIKGVPNYNRLSFDGKTLFIGPLVTFSDLIKNDDVKTHFRGLWEAATTVASCGVRNRATLAGNICSAVPSLDSAPALLVYEATVHLSSSKVKRDVAIGDWFKAPRKTALNPDEMVTGISINRPEKTHASIYKKLGRYSGEDLAQAGVGILYTDDGETRVAFCAVGPVASRSAKIEAFLKGKKLSAELISSVLELVPGEISPITDIRASKEYRIHMTQVMLGRALTELHERLGKSEFISQPLV